MVQGSHHLLLSHGLALQVLPATAVKCPLGIVLNISPATAATADPADIGLAEREYARMVRWLIEPVLLGRYPAEAAWPLPRQQDGATAIWRRCGSPWTSWAPTTTPASGPATPTCRRRVRKA